MNVFSRLKRWWLFRRRQKKEENDPQCPECPGAKYVSDASRVAHRPLFTCDLCWRSFCFECYLHISRRFPRLRVCQVCKRENEEVIQYGP